VSQKDVHRLIIVITERRERKRIFEREGRNEANWKR